MDMVSGSHGAPVYSPANAVTNSHCVVTEASLFWAELDTEVGTKPGDQSTTSPLCYLATQMYTKSGKMSNNNNNNFYC